MKLDLARQSERYIKKRVAAGLCSGSATRYQASYLRFGAFLEEKGIDDLRDVTEEVARDYQACVREMKHYKTKELLSDSSQRALLGAVRMFFRELYLEEKILADPFERVSLDRKRHQIPRGILSKDEIEALMTALRNRYGLFGLAIGEILYGTGIRASELHDLRVKDVNLKSRTLFIRNGKGKKDRIVPIPEGVAGLLRKYKRVCKPSLWFFESANKRRVSTNWMRILIHRASEDAGIKKNVTPHGIRHTFSTHLLAGGMDLRYIQQLLGHEEISTTLVYTRIQNEDLFKVYRETHPRA